MSNPVAAILLLVATVAASTIVVSYAVAIYDQAYTGGNLQLQTLPAFNQALLNQTSNDPYNPQLFNQTGWLFFPTQP
jgi:hypothetical protein